MNKVQYIVAIAALLVILIYPTPLLYVLALPAVLLGSIGVVIALIVVVVAVFVLVMLVWGYFQEKCGKE